MGMDAKYVKILHYTILLSNSVKRPNFEYKTAIFFQLKYMHRIPVILLNDLEDAGFFPASIWAFVVNQWLFGPKNE